MENESQKLYRVIIGTYSEIAHISKRSLNGRSPVYKFKREKLARELEKVYYVHFNNPDELSNINAFAEYVKRFGMDKRLPLIESVVRDILKQFFRNKEWKKNEIIFEHIYGPLKSTCLDILQAEIGRKFKIYSPTLSGKDLLRGHPFFSKPFTLKELVEWIYLNEKHSLKRGS